MRVELGNIGQFKELLLRACGHSFNEEREQALSSAVARRMAHCQLAEAEHYYSRLQSDPAELQQLVELLTVNETYFFREPEHLRLLVENLIPELLRQRKGETLRIVCLGCATGEEPYSLAMLLENHFGPESRQQFHLVAGDIDAGVLERARQGVYGPGSFRGGTEYFRQRFFTPVGPEVTDCPRSESWQLGEEIRSRVHFQQLNLLAESFPSAFQQPDVILYRNVSIYFPRPVQERIFHHLAALLKNDGLLLVGAAETMHHNLGILHLMARDSLFFFHKRSRPPLRKETGPDSSSARSEAAKREMGTDLFFAGSSSPKNPAVAAKNKSVPISLARDLRQRSAESGSAADHRVHPEVSGHGGGQVAASETATRASARDPAQSPQDAVSRGRLPEVDVAGLFSQALALARSRQFDPALALVEQLLVADACCSRAYALKGSIMAERDHYSEVRQLGLLALEHDPLCLEACLLLGVSARHLGDHVEAGRRFREALYVNRACWPAHFHLAEIAYGKGDQRLARRSYLSALAGLEEGDAVGQPTFFYPLSFDSGQLIHVCRHKLARLK